jgi:intein-encoded DNA endonuclease-like protein
MSDYTNTPDDEEMEILSTIEKEQIIKLTKKGLGTFEIAKQLDLSMADVGDFQGYYFGVDDNNKIKLNKK